MESLPFACCGMACLCGLAAVCSLSSDSLPPVSTFTDIEPFLLLTLSELNKRWPSPSGRESDQSKVTWAQNDRKKL